MAYITIADMQIVPDKFAAYTLQRTTEKSALVKSGIATGNSVLSALINGLPKGGRFIEMPYYKPLEGEDVVFNEDALDVSSIETGNCMATLTMRQKAWGDTDLSVVLSGSDPMAAVADLAADWWTVREQSMVLAQLKGILDPAKGALKSHVLDISSGATDNAISVDATLDTKNLMGDAYDKLGMVFMHSATYTHLQKRQNIDTVYDSDLKINIDYYLGYRVVVDDGMPVESVAASGDTAAYKKYTTYFLGKGAFAREDGTPAGFVSIETGREKLGAKNYLIHRRAMIIHPIGLSWNINATLTPSTNKHPANVDFAKPANWTLETSHKNVPIVAMVHRI